MKTFFLVMFLFVPLFSVRLTGAPTNGACLNRLRKKYNNFITAQDLPEAKELLLNGTVGPKYEKLEEFLMTI